jgi:hypothetical protein
VKRLPRGVPLVLAVQALGTALVVGWLASGRPGAPDAGLQQIDVLMLSERVPGVEPVDGRPTMLVVTSDACPDPGPRRLDDRYGLVVSTDPRLADRLALPKAADGCSPGYVLLDGDGVLRYRTYDPRWPEHDQEQEILLESIARGHR